MRGTIFDKDIPTFEHALVHNVEYEIEDVVIQKIPDSINKDVNPFTMNLNPKNRITPLISGVEVSAPKYIKLSSIPRTQDPNQELIDIAGVVLYIEKVRDVSVGNTVQHPHEHHARPTRAKSPTFTSAKPITATAHHEPSWSLHGTILQKMMLKR